MKQMFTPLELTRLAYSEVPKNMPLAWNDDDVNKEFALLKSMQNKVDSCLIEPSQKSINKILAALKSI